MNICVVGGAGYVGSELVPYLLHRGHAVTVLDTFWYGDHLRAHPSLKKIKGDIREISDLRKAFFHQDAVIHLACISNDPSFDMNPELGKGINYTCFKYTLQVLKECFVKKFIYASSSSVYGVSDLKDVTEESPKYPLTDYSKYKLMCEEDLKRSDYSGIWTILRPATVCGYAPRLRLDLVVNILTINAIVNNKITLFGHDQKRPNIHVNDMVRAYDFILTQEEDLVHQQTFNVGFENRTLYEIASLIKDVMKDNVEIEEQPTNDPRSYHINSGKLAKLGFKTRNTIRDAIYSLKYAYKRGDIKDPMNNTEYYNIKQMKKLEVK